MIRTLYAALFVTFGFIIFGVAAGAQPQAAIPAIDANDNRVPAGTLAGGVLRLSLDTRVGFWFPDGPNKPDIPVEAFGEAGKPLQIPGPLVRVPLGTLIVARIHNSLPGTVLSIHGLIDRPARADRAFALRYGEERVVRFRANAAGTYYYWATTTGQTVATRLGRDSQLSGAIVVDDAAAAHAKSNPRTDRVFVITEWDDVRDAKGGPMQLYQIETINGRSYPSTERLSYTRGDLVRWHIVNTSFEDHPLHLHGFYFRVDSRGDGLHDEIFPAGSQRERKVTEQITSGSTSLLTWRATRAGNWMFHCHLAYHVIAHAQVAWLADGHHNLESLEHSGKMGGMILKIKVEPKPGDEPIAGAPVTRHLDLLVERASADSPHDPAFAYVVQENGATTAGTGEIGPAIVLTRGQTVGINIVNHLNEPTAVHWHGIELQNSYYDGIPGISGYGNRLEPMIDPGNSFEAVFAPPRAGTFIYHTHMDDVWQLRAGLTGPLIVLPPGARFDAATDHVIQITTPRNPNDYAWLDVNGTRNPPAMTMSAGVPQRLRFINMTTFDTGAVVSLVSATGGIPMAWVPIASDGADLAASRQRYEPAVQAITIGETRDFTFLPPRAPGEYRLLFWQDPGGKVRVTIPIHVVNPS